MTHCDRPTYYVIEEEVDEVLSKDTILRIKIAQEKISASNTKGEIFRHISEAVRSINSSLI